MIHITSTELNQYEFFQFRSESRRNMKQSTVILMTICALYLGALIIPEAFATPHPIDWGNVDLPFLNTAFQQK